MPIDENKRKIIMDIMNSQNAAAGGIEKIDKRRLVIAGKVILLPIYRFELSQIAFNKSNGRIKSEVLEKESNIGRELYDTPEDQETIKNILLSLRRDENNKTKEDLIKNGQMEPGIITCDGVIINGNRRKAILEEIYTEDSSEKFKYFEALVLPSNIRKSELWLIEAGIQLSATQQLDYSPINHLLKLKEGIDSGLKIPEMASRIYGVNEDKIKSDLERLKIIDEYLDEFIKKPNRYYLVENLNEHFINLQSNLNWANNPRGNIRLDWSPDKSDINELKIVCFYYIRQKFPHLRIREIRKQFGRRTAWDYIRKSIELLDTTQEEKFDNGDNTINDLIDDNDLDIIEDQEAIRDIVEEQDKKDESDWRKRHENTLKRCFQDAQEQVGIEEDKEQPLKLAKRALKIIDAIPLDNNTKIDEIDDILSDIIKKINLIRDKVRKTRNKSKKKRKSK